MNTKAFTRILVILLSIATQAGAQQYFRIAADFTVKSKSASGDQSLTMGKVRYDRNQHQILYDVSFPDKELWVAADTVIYRIKDKRLVSKSFSPSLSEFSVFHLALNSHLQDFGLKSSQYTLDGISREGEMVISTWKPPANLADKLGNILVSTIDKKLYGVVFMDYEGKVLRKQFFDQYMVVDGLAFPGRITEIYYVNDKEDYQVTSFKNLKVDEMDYDDLYFFPVHQFR